MSIAWPSLFWLWNQRPKAEGFSPFSCFASLPFLFPACVPVSVYDSWYFTNGQQHTIIRVADKVIALMSSPCSRATGRRWTTLEFSSAIKFTTGRKTRTIQQQEKWKKFTRTQPQQSVCSRAKNFICRRETIQCVSTARRPRSVWRAGCTCMRVCAPFPPSLSL